MYETPSSGENLQMTNTDDKENQNRSIIDDILAEHPMEVMNEDPFDPSASHKSVSTPLKILSPNKRLTMGRVSKSPKVNFNITAMGTDFRSHFRSQNHFSGLDSNYRFLPLAGAFSCSEVKVRSQIFINKYLRVLIFNFLYGTRGNPNYRNSR